MYLTRRHFGFTLLASLADVVLSPFTRTRLFAQMLEEADSKCAGPMVGHATDSTASLWMYTPDAAGIDVRFTGPTRGTVRIEKVPTDGLGVKGQPWKAHLSDLLPGTPYDYEVVVNGQASPEHRGSFRTAPKPGAPGKFRLGVTSCMKVEKPQTSWPHFLEEKPDLHLTIGDTVYADSTDPKIQWRHHLRYRQLPGFASVVRNMPTYSMWDDHDFGPNNSDRTSKGKEGSLEGWKRVWINPGAGTPQTPGSFYRFAWGDVDFFVVDGRYHRSPGKDADDEKKTMLGEQQFEWLVDGLKSSTAKFKMVVSGSPLDHSMHDGWRIYTHARHQFFDAIKTNKISGVVYISGSLHNSLAWEHKESDRVGYPMVEVISSGIANSKRLGYATLDFDTAAADPTMTVRIVNPAWGSKKPKVSAWKLSQLSHKA